MTGLNETQIAHSGFLADVFFQNYRLDILYMPHPDYQDIIQDISCCRIFTAEYDIYTASELSVAMSVAISRRSRYYQRIKAIIEGNL